MNKDRYFIVEYQALKLFQVYMLLTKYMTWYLYIIVPHVSYLGMRELLILSEVLVADPSTTFEFSSCLLLGLVGICLSNPLRPLQPLSKR